MILTIKYGGTEISMKKRLLLIPVTAIAVIAGIWTQKPVTAKAADDFVIVLDPGHDATHVGARGYGLKEEELNMKIALSCKAELEKYDGVKVYLTHPTIDCGLPGSSTRECLYSRPDYAKSVGASLYVSLHNNAGMDTSGHEVYYPNANYIPEFNVEGAALAQCISDKLSDIGINDRGIHTRDSNGDEDDETNWYDDGSRADYYAVIRGSKKNGFIGLIVEHAYISNANDASLLGDDNMLALMGQADAQGIAEYYGFAKKSGLRIGNDDIWHMYSDGDIVSDYTGMAENEYGWWMLTDGSINFDYTGMAENQYGWWYISNGALDLSYTGMAENEYGWWYMSNGALDLNYTGMARNEYGWWYINKGLLDSEYTGIASNEYGEWYFVDGVIAYDYTDEIEADGHTYVITNGYVTQVKHSWDDGVTVTEATCTDNGIIRYTCKSCDKTKEEVIKAKGHEYSWVVAKPATTSEEGLEEYKCLVCGDVKETRKLEKLQAEGDKKTDNNNVSDKNITDKDVADKDIANKNITDKISSDNKASADNKQIDRSTKDDVISSVNNQ